MQNSWIGIALMAVVVLIGLVVGIKLSPPGSQRRAVIGSLGGVSLVVILFFLVAIVFSQRWAAPVFAVACIVVPVAIYVGMTEMADAAKRREKTKAKPADAPKLRTAKAEAPAAQEAEESLFKPVIEPKKPKLRTPSKPAAGKTAASKPARGSHTPKPAKVALPFADLTTTKVVPVGEVNMIDLRPLAEEQEERRKAAEEAALVQEAPAAEEPSVVTSPFVAEDLPEAEPLPAEEPVVEPAPGPRRPASSALPDITDVWEVIEPDEPPAAVEAVPAVEVFTFAEPEPVVTPEPEPVVEIAPEPAVVPEPEPVFEPAPAVEVAPEPEPVVEPAPELELVVEPARVDITPQITPVVAVEPEPEPVVKPEPTPVVAPAPVAEPAPAPEPEPAAEPGPYEGYCAKAQSLRDRGVYPIAARLFAEAAAAAPTAEDARRARFDELACYVKAGDGTKARAIAAELRQSSVLTRIERMKLDAVERMG
ncbi:MAG: hypothetical protein HFJ75_01960 [Eggerthellaceae bacterium]|nr:hypothetical protein [Eggerthellaceae bacterium]